MALVCPKCQSSYEQRLDCPKCGVRLLLPEQAQAAGFRPRFFRLTEPVRETQWPKLLIGLLLAQGIYYGLRQMTLAINSGTPPAGGWDGLAGVVLRQAFLTVGLLAGGMLGGAGQRRGLVLGAIVGLANAALYLLAQFVSRQPINPVEWYGQPIVQVAFGALGGFLGSRIWNPEPVVPPSPSLAAALHLPVATPTPRRSKMEGPIAWLRVATGVVMVVGGTLWADAILDLVARATENKLAAATKYQAEFLTWEMSILAMFGGCAWAGANTRNGPKQGLVVGLASSAILAGIYVFGLYYDTNPNGPAQSQGLREYLGLQLRFLVVLNQHLVLLVATGTGLGLLGGWFGGELLPPVVAYPRSKGLGPLS